MSFIESEDQKKKSLLYRRVFNTPDGKKVLEDMILELNVFSSISPEDTERMALRNYGLMILYNLGIMLDGNVSTIVDRLMSMDYKVSSTDKEK